MGDSTAISLVQLPDAILSKWQTITDTLANFIGVPAALVMRLVRPKIKVLVSSHSEGNPYSPGDSETFENSGLYCETVIKTRRKLLVPNALKDKHWRNNPDIKLNMISYLGYPVNHPNGEPFGTICVLDYCENHYTPEIETMLYCFRDNLQLQLQISYMLDYIKNQELDPLNYLDRMFTKGDMLPICSFCKKVRDPKGNWDSMERYLTIRFKTRFSHSICPECYEENYKSTNSK